MPGGEAKIFYEKFYDHPPIISFALFLIKRKEHLTWKQSLFQNKHPLIVLKSQNGFLIKINSDK
jgi:hypothetical protein